MESLFNLHLPYITRLFNTIDILGKKTLVYSHTTVQPLTHLVEGNV